MKTLQAIKDLMCCFSCINADLSCYKCANPNIPLEYIGCRLLNGDPIQKKVSEWCSQGKWKLSLSCPSGPVVNLLWGDWN